MSRGPSDVTIDDVTKSLRMERFGQMKTVERSCAQDDGDILVDPVSFAPVISNKRYLE